MRSALIALVATIWLATPTDAAQFFPSSGGTVDFVKVANADETDPATWDVLSPSVALARAAIQGIFNPFAESSYDKGTFLAPTGTRWYFGGTVDGVLSGDIELADFDTWFNAHEGNPLATIDVDGVVYLEAEDAYVDIRFTEWSISNGGSFAYTRAMIIPEPATALLAAIGFAGGRRRS